MSAADSKRLGNAGVARVGGASRQREVSLAGCSPIPLASYLKALGVLRLVAEQADPEARGFWRNEHFVLMSRLDEEELCRFFLETYGPTPVLAPWNGGSGFYPGDNQSGITPIESSDAPRYRSLRDAIQTIRRILRQRQLATKPEGNSKTSLLVRLRAELQDDALTWLDAAVLLTDENPRYPPLLGTGGNDGRLDFTNNFVQRLVGLFDPATGAALPEAASRLDEALFETAVSGMEPAAIGQFAPGNAGGPNQATGFEAKALVNPWDFVLMLEGALLFSAAATRRLETTWPGALSYPFTVRSVGAGSGGTALGDEGNARAEIWAPLWGAPATLHELRALLAEGRATLGRHPAVDSLDFVRSVSRLGIDRGIHSFQRYAFLMRSGKAYFATPLNRVSVGRNPKGDLVDELDNGRWLARFRRLARSETGNRLSSLVHRLEDAIFELSLEREHPAPRIQRLLGILGQVQLYLARSPKAQEACPPVPWLSKEWLAEAQDGSDELAIAAALAGLHGRASRSDHGRTDWVMPMRAHLASESYARQPYWGGHASHSVTWGVGSLEDNLAATLQRRMLEATRTELVDKPLEPSRTAPLAAVAAWLADRLDNSRLASLLPGLMLVRIPAGADTRVMRDAPLPAAYRALKPFFCTDVQLVRTGILGPDGQLNIPAELVRRLAVGDTAAALAVGVRRLRAAGTSIGFQNLTAGVTAGRRLLATLMVPIADQDLERLLPRRVEQEERRQVAS